MTSLGNQWKTLALWVVIPFVVSYLFSAFVMSDGVLESMLVSFFPAAGATRDLNQSGEGQNISLVCQQRFGGLLGLSTTDQNPFEGISLMIHRNGQPESCGEAVSDKGFLQELMAQYASFPNAPNSVCPSTLDKYQVETLLTRTFQKMLSSCLSEERDGNTKAGFLGFCDLGPKRTPILLDHDDLIPVTKADGSTSLPCRFHTREGLRITDLKQLVQLARLPSTVVSKESCETQSNLEPECAVSQSTARSLYAVPAGRVFMFAPSFVGEIFHLPHVQGSENRTIYLEVMSLEPRVFDVFNFFSRDESQELVERALAETKESHRIKRSSTGPSGYNLNSKRTSESGFDTHGQTAVKVKKRCFELLGFDHYWESHGDGLQILRYNVSKAYNSHLDWIEDKTGELEHDFESGGSGGNRFATILMYMSDMGPDAGGETVFPKGWPPHLDPSDRVSAEDALEALRASEQGNVLVHGSWEERLVAQCRTRLAVRPHSSRAVLFYSQYPNGEVDPASLHGACPVLSGQKYAANLWAWNTPRQGYPGAPIKEKFRKEKGATNPSNSPTPFKKIHGTFKNSGKDKNMDSAELFFEDQFWGKMGPKDTSLTVNTYQGHTWNVKVDGKIVKSWTVTEGDGVKQHFTI
jgi:2OG-Fe(II) oxygenase superfamily